MYYNSGNYQLKHPKINVECLYNIDSRDREFQTMSAQMQKNGQADRCDSKEKCHEYSVLQEYGRFLFPKKNETFGISRSYNEEVGFQKRIITTHSEIRINSDKFI